jgi:AAA15 family ATPase/GTPase
VASSLSNGPRNCPSLTFESSFRLLVFAQEGIVLTQINKIKGVGIFDDYSAAADFPVFGRFNLVYGKNGSGKTTLSRC